MIKMMKNSSVAVIGASNDPEKYGYKIVKRLLEKGFKVYPINLKQEKILGLTAYKKLADLPVQPDIINFVVSPAVSLQVLDEVKQLNWDNVWFQPGAFDEKVIDKAKKLGLNYVDDACIMVFASQVSK